MSMSEGFVDAINKRADLTERLIAALAHFPAAQQLGIVTAFFSLQELEDITKFQEDRQ